MFMNKFLLYMFLIACAGNVSAMEIINGKRYKTNGGTLVTIEGDCKEMFGVDSLETIGELTTHPACLVYLQRCIEESGKILLAAAFVNEIISGDQATLRACLAEKYRGKFYYAKGATVTMCVHPSWLTPVGDVDNHEIKEQNENVAEEGNWE